MARPILTPEQIEQFRTRAVEVSLRLFVEEGYQRFSMRSLAREMGCSHTTPYRYFEGKAEIFAASRAEGFRRFASFLRARLAASAEPIERLRILARAYFDFAQQHSIAFTVIFEMGQPAPQQYPFVDEAGFDAWCVLLNVVREAVEAEVIFGEVNQVAHTMWAGIHGVATLQLAQKLRMGLRAKVLIESMMEALIEAHRNPRAESSPRTESGIVQQTSEIGD